MVFHPNERLCNSKIFRSQSWKAIIKEEPQLNILGQWLYLASWNHHPQGVGDLEYSKLPRELGKETKWGVGGGKVLWGGGEVRSSTLFSLEYSGELCYKFSKVVQLYPYKAAYKYITSISTGFNFNHDALSFLWLFSGQWLLILEISVAQKVVI